MDTGSYAIIIAAFLLAYLTFGDGFRRTYRWYNKMFVCPKRLEYINRYRFGSAPKDKMRELHPRLTTSETDQAFEGLRQFLLIAHAAQGEVVMPSRAVDDAWHQFILFTDEYSRFCESAFGKFFRHKPYAKNVDNGEPATVVPASLKTWAIPCHLEGISYEQPKKLPLLFSIDADLEIDNGNVNTLDSEQIGLYTSAARQYRKQGRDGVNNDDPSVLWFCGGDSGGGSSCGGCDT